MFELKCFIVAAARRHAYESVFDSTKASPVLGSFKSILRVYTDQNQYKPEMILHYSASLYSKDIGFMEIGRAV